MTHEGFNSWLTAYGNAWTQQNPEAVNALFSEGAAYYETPFSEAMAGREAIRQYWQEGAQQAQRDIEFVYEVLAVEGSFGVARWRATFTRVPSGRQVELDGVLYARFDAAQRCDLFREWWHRMEDGGKQQVA